MTPERWQQVKAVFQPAVECEPGQRPAVLDQACNGDLALRSQVEALLASHEQSPNFLEYPTLNVTALLTEDEVDFMVGQKIGPYEVLREIGWGGMGEVYRAHDARLDRDVALKVVSRHLADNPEALARFEREAKAVAALSHPNILAIHELATDQGISYAVTELLEGESLREHLSHKPLGWHRAVEIAIDIADGLAAAHGKGIIHRDLKPENVFVTSEARVKILDFGLARTTSNPSAGEQETRTTSYASAADQESKIRCTETGMLLGTVGYMSPEQVRGERVGAASDVFSFGCVLYEMLSGLLPFVRQTTAETLAATLNDDPAPIGDVLKAAPKELERLLWRCLAKKLEDRYPSGRELAIDLRRILTTAAEERVRLRVRLWTLAAVGVLLLATLSMIMFRSPAAVKPEISLLPMPRQITANPTDNGVFSAAISPDGKNLAYADLNGLHILAIDTGETRNILAPENFCPR